MATATKTKDAIALLKADHKKVKDLFDDFEDADEGEKESIAQEACKELKIHSVIEEEIFYPAIRQALGEDESDIMDEAEEEHRVAKTLIEELSKGGSGEHFEAKFTVLAENVRHHIKEEEGEMFKEARGADVDLEELGEQMLARKQELMENESALDEAVESSELKPYQELK